MPDEWTFDQWIAAVRAEIERDGVHVAVSDEELREALLGPLRDARRKLDDAFADLARAVAKTAQAVQRLSEAMDLDEPTHDQEDRP